MALLSITFTSLTMFVTVAATAVVAAAAAAAAVVAVVAAVVAVAAAAVAAAAGVAAAVASMIEQDVLGKAGRRQAAATAAGVFSKVSDMFSVQAELSSLFPKNSVSSPNLTSETFTDNFSRFSTSSVFK